MKKIILTAFLTLVLISAFGFGVYAQSARESYDEVYEYADSQTRELLRDAGVNSVNFDELVSLSPQRFISLITDITKDSLSLPLKSSAGLMAVLILFSVINVFYSDKLKDDGYYDFFESSVVLISVLVPLSEQLSEAIGAISLSSGFMAMYVPVFTALVSSSGQPMSSFAYSASVLGFAELCNTALVNAVLPVIGVITCIGVYSCLNTGINADRITALIKRIMTVFLSSVSVLFVGLTNLRAKLTVSADSLALKGIKTVSGGLIPIIGSSLGDALSSTLSAFSLIKNTVGAFGIVAVALIFLPSVVRLVIWYFCLSVCQLAGEALGVKCAPKILGALLNAVSLINIILILCALIFILTTGNMLSLRS